MHDNRHVRSPAIITTALYGTRMAHIFIRVCTLIYNGVSPSLATSATIISRKRQRSSRADSHRTGMRDRRDSRPVAGTQPESSVEGDSCRGVQHKTILRLGHVALDVQMGTLPAMQRASTWWRNVSMRRCEEACDDFSLVREMLVVEVMSFW